MGAVAGDGAAAGGTAPVLLLLLLLLLLSLLYLSPGGGVPGRPATPRLGGEVVLLLRLWQHLLWLKRLGHLLLQLLLCNLL